MLKHYVKNATYKKEIKLTEIKLRPWQAEPAEKTIHWLVNLKNKHFLANCCPASGKTIYAAYCAARMIALNEIDRVIVIAPTKEVVRKWSEEFLFVTKRHMTKVTSSDDGIQDFGVDLCATWAAVDGLLEAFQRVCASSRTLVICDEHHHAAIQAAWGHGAGGAFALAKHVIVLTGTPMRTDGGETVWFSHTDQGKINHPEDGTYTLTYGEAVDLGYCRPITFHRHEGNFKVSIDDGTEATVSGEGGQNISKSMKNIRGIDKALEFYNLACKIPYQADGVTEEKNSYQRSMLEEAVKALEKTQERMPHAGGLVIAPNIEVAEYMSRLLEDITNKKPIIVHSNLANAENRISAYRNSTNDWLVSVNMVSEGVDIPRLRVLAYLPFSQTELTFRQAMGRVVRSDSIEDDTYAYIVMPNTEIFDRYAERVEKEMSPHMRSDDTQNRTKKCPVCDKENSLSAKVCECGYEFPERKQSYKECPNQECLTLNPVTAKECEACGTSFSNQFTIKLEDALRMGAIVRGMQLSEEEVQESEKIADQVREDILSTGDEIIIRMFRKFPDESFSRIMKVLKKNEQSL